MSTLTSQSGVYSMYDAFGKVIYVGKAKNLKKRLSSYFRLNISNRKTEVLVKNIHHIDIAVTHTETEALLLEQNYIKVHRPKYNVLLRDDKSYSFIFLSEEQHPRLVLHRGPKRAKGDYFGPFPNNYLIKETLSLLKKMFPIRQCNDNTYRNRSRPCLQYQIGHCLGPCIKGLVSDEEYKQQVEYVRLFLLNKDQQVLNKLVEKMDIASRTLKFEDAAYIRDQIKTVKQVTEKQYVSGEKADLDVISISFNNGIACMHVLFIREGKMIGNQNFFLKTPIIAESSEIKQTFISQFYLYQNQKQFLPLKILLDFSFPERKLFSSLLSKQAGKKICIETSAKGDNVSYLKLARINAEAGLITELAQSSTMHYRMLSLSKVLGVKKINRIECFDVSHIMGEQTVASCVVFNKDGPVRSECRHYNIKHIIPGDDCAAIGKALQRRYNRNLKEEKIPDVIIIDGGKGQLGIAKKIFSQLEISWDKSRVILVSIAKRKSQKNNFETLFFQPYGKGLTLTKNSSALNAIQYIRDYAHNLAITFHRKKRNKEKSTSTLELIKGIGPKRRQLLLKYMGGLQSLSNANIEDITKIPGISHILASKIFNTLKK
nr:excinuclease ABC subunit UvrC [Sodalis sp. CWE]